MFSFERESPMEQVRGSAGMAVHMRAETATRTGRADASLICRSHPRIVKVSIAASAAAPGLLDAPPVAPYLHSYPYHHLYHVVRASADAVTVLFLSPSQTHLVWRHL